MGAAVPRVNNGNRYRRFHFILSLKMVGAGIIPVQPFLLFVDEREPTIIEAKDNKHSIGAGMQQAINHGNILDIPFVYSSNGDGFIEHDRIGNGKPLDEALQHATTEMLSLLCQDYGLTVAEASLLLGQAVEYEVANVFNPAYSVVCKLPKALLSSI